MQKQTQSNAIILLKKLLPGVIASLFTQPLDVLKTNMINSPSLDLKQIHHQIIHNGYQQYMRGVTVAMFRQAFGFAIYSSLINVINQHLSTTANYKFWQYSTAAIIGKIVAMTLQSPLTLLKTRMELISSNRTISQEISYIMKNPKQYITKGLYSTLARECIYSAVHYNIYRYLKDNTFSSQTKGVFMSAFIGSILGITFSQPFQVIRNKVSIKLKLSIWECSKNIWIQQGWRGFFVGFLPRLLRKPINSGICWSVMEMLQGQQRK